MKTNTKVFIIIGIIVAIGMITTFFIIKPKRQKDPAKPPILALNSPASNNYNAADFFFPRRAVY